MTQKLSYNEWNKKINKIKITSSIVNDKVLPNIKKMVKKFSKEYSIIKIDDDKLNRALDNIGNRHKTIVTFDIEFQNMLLSKDDRYRAYQTIFDKYGAPFIREFGAIIFIKDDDNYWYYIGKIFVNFPSLYTLGIDMDYIRYFTSNYTTTTRGTQKLMEDNDTNFNVDHILDKLLDKKLFERKKDYMEYVKKIERRLKKHYLIQEFIEDFRLQNILNVFKNIKKAWDYEYIEQKVNQIKRYLSSLPFNIYGKYLRQSYKEIVFDQYDLYWEDSMVKQRLIKEKDAIVFIDLLQDIGKYSYFIVKGRRDFDALDNSYMMLNDVNKTYLQLNFVYDIETFNGLSGVFYKGAKLETTYRGMIQEKIYKEHAHNFFDKLIKDIGEQAHNPLVDSLLTIVVASTLNLMLNDYYGQQKGGEINKYMLNYQKCRNQYMNLKYNKSNLDIGCPQNKLIKMDVSQINKNNTYVIVDLNFTNKEKKILENFSILNTKTYDRYGEIDLVDSELPKYLESIGNNDEESINILTRLIVRIIHSFQGTVNKPSAWITIRISEPHHGFDIPRWHMDGRYFGENDTPSLKLVTTLKGPPTLLSNSKQKNIRQDIQNLNFGKPMHKLYQQLKIASQKNDKKQIYELQEKIKNLRITSREKIVKILDEKTITQMDNGQAAIYTVNNSDYGCIHSEPPITQNRIFMSILPGTIDEINEMKILRKIK